MSIKHPDGEAIRIFKAGEDATDFDVADIPAGRELSYSTVANGIGGALNALTLDDVRRAIDSDDAVATTFETFDGMTVTVATTRDDDATWIALSAAGGADDTAETLNARWSGWQYRIADYKANLFTRRWEDILKAEETDAE